MKDNCPHLRVFWMGCLQVEWEIGGVFQMAGYGKQWVNTDCSLVRDTIKKMSE